MANIYKEKNKYKKIRAIAMLLILDILITPLLVYIVNCFIKYNLGASTVIIESLKAPLEIYKVVFTEKQNLIFFFILQGVPLVVIFNILFPNKVNLKDTTDTMKVANFEIPKAVGKGQMGTSRFTTDEEKQKTFSVWKEGEPLKSGGMILGTEQKGKDTYFYYDKDDVNTLIIGTTRSGKSRREYLPSIYLLANSGESIFVNDPKGELYTYTNEYLREKEYKVINLDFRSPEKSMRYNYLYYINEEIKKGNKDKAIEMVWDIVAILVGESKGDKLWNNGEASVLASAILYICFEAPEDKYKNLTNVYYFIANMCKADSEGQMPITKLMDKLPVNHPSRGAFAVAELAPERTRGSFFTSALATLRLFIDTKIADMTSATDEDLNIIASEKVAIFCTIPDEKKTRHVLSTLLIDQLYMNLVEIANNNGGRLKQRVNMLIDEFGNLPKINGFDNKLTVCLGRGIRFILAIQGIGQLYSVYEKDIAETITSNCHDWIYLLTTDTKSAEIISKQTGEYTVQTKSVSSSTSLGTKTNSSVNYSSSANVTKRALLTPDEIMRLQPPWSLVIRAREYPSIFNLPDLSKLKANKYYGMGDPQHNIELTKAREEAREIRKIKEVKIWLPMLEEMINQDIENSNEFENIDNIDFSGSSDTNINELDFIG